MKNKVILILILIVVLIVLSLSAMAFVGGYRKPEPEMVLRVTETGGEWIDRDVWENEWKLKE